MRPTIPLALAGLLSACADAYDDPSFDEPSVERTSQGLAVAHKDGKDIIWDEQTRARLTYCVEKGDTGRYAGFGEHYDRVVAQMKDATRAWSDIADVDFKHVEGEDECDYCDPRAAGLNPCPSASKIDALFAVVPWTSGKPNWQENPDNADSARATFLPNKVVIGSHAFIEVGSGEYAGSAAELEQLLMHEIGHTLGFLHEHHRRDIPNDPRRMDCPIEPLDADRAGFDIRSITAYDRYSVMHYPARDEAATCGGRDDATWYAMSPLDAMGAACVYGSQGSGRVPDYCDVIDVLPAFESPYVSITASLILPAISYIPPFVPVIP